MKHIAFVLASLLPATALAQSSEPAPAAPLPPLVLPGMAPAPTAPKRFAVEFGPVVGLSVPTSALGVGPDLGLEVGGRLALGPGVFAFALRGAWQRYSLAQSAAAPCSPMGSGASNANAAPDAPCVSEPSPGSYDYSVQEDTVRLSLPLSYRFLRASSAFNAYVGVAPLLVLQRAQTSAWNLVTTETGMQFGVGGLAGAQYTLGPGALWFEAGYAWAPVQHKVTGDASLGSVTLALGYRISL